MGPALIQLLSSDKNLGLMQIALAADVIAADARFNAWLAVEGKKTLSDEAILETIDVYEDTMTECFAAIERFKSNADHGELEVALGRVLETLRKSCRRWPPSGKPTRCILVRS